MIIMDNDILKKYSGKLICGVDEVGRGPLAGPVVACAVIMGNEKIDGVKDSKKLSAKKREALNKEIIEKAKAIGIGVVDEKVIDEISGNLHQTCEQTADQCRQPVKMPVHRSESCTYQNRGNGSCKSFGTCS